VGLLAAATRLGHLDPAPTLVAVIVVAVYRPAYRVLRRASVFRRAHAQPYELLSETALPGVVGLTNLFTYLRPEDRAGWDRPPTQGELADLARGVALGAAAWSATFGVAAARGWMSAPAWGWQNGLRPGDVVASAALLAAQKATLLTLVGYK